jgi:hypothetical protein
MSITPPHQCLPSQIVSSIELNRQQRKMDLYRQHDQEEVKEMFVHAPVVTRRQPSKLMYLRLQALVRSIEDLQSAVGMRDDVPALMQTIQEVISIDLSGGLWDL